MISNFLFHISVVIILSCYFLTLSPSIAGGDSGELVAEGCNLGTPHPPGYPLFMLLTHVLFWMRENIALLSNIRVAYLVNVTSACFTAGAAALVGMITGHFTGNNVGAIMFSMGMFAFSPLIWQYATTAEVFPLNTFFAALLVYVTIQFAVTRNMKLAIFGAFICGLSLCNQHTILLFEAPLILYITLLIRNVLLHYPMFIVYIGTSFFVGLLPYGLLPVTAFLKPNTGSWGYVLTLQGFLHHFLRRDYGTFQLFSGNKPGKPVPEGFSERTIAYVVDLFATQGLYLVPILIIIALLGLFVELSLRKAAATEVHTATKSTKNSCGSGGNDTSAGVKCSKKKKTGRANVGDANTSNNETPQAGTQSESLLVLDVAKNLISPVEVQVTLPFLLPLILLFYFGVFHTLSNLPLSDRLLYGVHQRFWMQPNVISFALAGIGFFYVFKCLEILLVPIFNGRKDTPSASTATNSDNSTGGLSNKTRCEMYVFFLSTLSAFVLVYIQYVRWLFVSDQSGSMYFERYAAAILSPLPFNSLLLVNYDQQWTSIRYMQNCEHYRDDITTINLSMMSYDWFSHKRQYFNQNKSTPIIKFPGDRYGSASGKSRRDASKGNEEDNIITLFTMTDFLQANMKSFEKSGIYLSGKLSYPDSNVERLYENVPIGMVARFLPRRMTPSVDIKKRFPALTLSQLKVSPTAHQYVPIMLESWKKVLNHLNIVSTTRNIDRGVGVGGLPGLPALDRFEPITWEWTISRDMKDRINDMAAFLLEIAIQDENIYPRSLVVASYMLEVALYYETYIPLKYSSLPIGESNKKSLPFQEYLSSVSYLSPLGRDSVDVGNKTILADELIPVAYSPPSALLKNAGLGHLHLIQNSKLSIEDYMPLRTHEDIAYDIFDINFNQYEHVGHHEFMIQHMNYTIRWPRVGSPQHHSLDKVKDYNVERFMSHWKDFLSRPDASGDSQYATIKNIFDTVLATKQGNKTPATGSKPVSKGNNKKSGSKRQTKSSKG